MKTPLTITQKQRLTELDADGEIETLLFDTPEERDRTFLAIHKELVRKAKARLRRLRDQTRRPTIRLLEKELVDILTRTGFVEVVTPTILSEGMLDGMGITHGHPLREQIYWVEKKSCLRPMLAPHLYVLLRRLARLWPLPIRIFEIGQCFRKESKGARHVSEFTMLNVVEMGIDADPQTRLLEIVELIMGRLDLTYEVHRESSEVYGNTTDILIEGMEIASGAVGPHPLDTNWEIADNWAGLGVGLERLVMAREGFKNIARAGRSVIYLDGARLNI